MIETLLLTLAIERQPLPAGVETLAPARVAVARLSEPGKAVIQSTATPALPASDYRVPAFVIPGPVYSGPAFSRCGPGGCP